MRSVRLRTIIDVWGVVQGKRPICCELGSRACSSSSRAAASPGSSALNSQWLRIVCGRRRAQTQRADRGAWLQVGPLGSGIADPCQRAGLAGKPGVTVDDVKQHLWCETKHGRAHDLSLPLVERRILNAFDRTPLSAQGNYDVEYGSLIPGSSIRLICAQDARASLNLRSEETSVWSQVKLHALRDGHDANVDHERGPGQKP